MKSYMQKVLAGALVLGMAGSACAATVVYDDKTEWEAAVGVYSTETFEDDNLNLGVSVLSDMGSVDTTNQVWWDRLQPISHGTETTTTWNFEEKIMSFGGNWDLAAPQGSGAGIIAVVINGEEIEVGEIDNEYSGQFWGFVSDIPFTSVLLKSGTQAANLAETYEFDDMVYSSSYPIIDVSVDVHPGGCPNKINLKSKGVTPMAILGTEEFDVADVNISSLTINGQPLLPTSYAYEDVATPYEGTFSDPADKDECNEYEGDGYMDLTLTFNTQDLGLVKGEQYLEINGTTLSTGAPITGKDVIWVK